MDPSIKNNRNRVFFHELGHFVAGELNKRLYGHLGTVSIHITPSTVQYGEYEGACEPEKPDNYVETDEPIPHDRLSQYLTRISYGCIFQACYQKRHLNDCIRENGCDDFVAWKHAIDKCGHYSVQKELFTAMNDYFLRLKDEDALKFFFEINPDDFMEGDEAGGYTINVDNLGKRINSFIDAHSKDYSDYVNSYKAKLSSPREG